MAAKSEPKECQCCEHIYQWERGMSTVLCPDCYAEGCMPIDRIGCSMGRKPPEDSEGSDKPDWHHTWDEATRPYLYEDS